MDKLKSKVIKEISKVEVFTPKRKYNQPKNAMFVSPGTSMIFKLDDVVVTITNHKDQNVYVRTK